MFPSHNFGLLVWKVMSQIEFDLYRSIIDVLPILCVDIVMKAEDKFVLVKRRNEPLKGRWWVPGGRVLKGESIIQAAQRKSREELGIQSRVLGAMGYYEKHFKKNEYSLDSGVHTISIVVVSEPLSMEIRLDDQSSDWKLSPKLPGDFRIKRFNPEILP